MRVVAAAPRQTPSQDQIRPYPSYLPQLGVGVGLLLGISPHQAEVAEVVVAEGHGQVTPALVEQGSLGKDLPVEETEELQQPHIQLGAVVGLLRLETTQFPQLRVERAGMEHRTAFPGRQ